jgi:hypothetical protein
MSTHDLLIESETWCLQVQCNNIVRGKTRSSVSVSIVEQEDLG